MLKVITCTTLLFYLFYCFYWGYYSKYYLEYVISLQIKSSLVPISNNPNRFSINLKEKNYTDNTSGKVFLLNSVRRLQKLSDLCRWGALLQEFRVRGKPRSVTCVHNRWQLEWNTPGSPERYAGIFCGLLSKHRRYQAFTFLKPNPKSDRKSNRKP